jgi:hypothetical protein
MLRQWLWIMVCYSEPVVVNHAVLCYAQWLWIVMYYAEQRGWESWFIMLSQWLWIMLYYATHHDSQPLAQQNKPWFTATGSAIHIMTNNHWLSITHHDSQPMAPYKTPWFTTTERLWIMLCYIDSSGCESWCVMLRQWLWIRVCYSEPVVVNHAVLS